MSRYEVVYLTGAPAAGKSSLSRAIRRMVTPLEVWEFGERLTAHLNQGSGTTMSQEDLRRESARAATPADVAAFMSQTTPRSPSGRGERSARSWDVGKLTVCTSCIGWTCSFLGTG